MATGADEFAALARRLKDAGETGLRRELYKAISDAAKPLGPEIRAGAARYMPDPYAAVLAPDLSVTVSKLTGRDPGVRLVGAGRTKKRKTRRLNEGYLTHPLFGDREHWYTQGPHGGGMRPGFFTDPVEKSAPRVKAAIIAAVEDVARKLTAGG